jgi:hypothetical protein
MRDEALARLRAEMEPETGSIWQNPAMTDVDAVSSDPQVPPAPDSPKPNGQLGLLDLSVDLSAPEVYSGTEFTLYLHVKNPFSRPVWIKSVELSLPTQLSAQEPKGTLLNKSDGKHSDDEFLRSLIRQRAKEIKQLNKAIQRGNLDEAAKSRAEGRLRELEHQTRIDYLRISGGLVTETGHDSSVTVTRARTDRLNISTGSDSSVKIFDFQDTSEPVRVPLLSSLPPGAALQPGSTDVWTIRLGSRRTPFFVPARYKLQLTVIYALEAPKQEKEKQGEKDRQGEKDNRDLYSNTTAFTTQVRAALWGVIIGGVVGGVTGSIARSLQYGSGFASFNGSHAGSTIGALALSAILSFAAVVFSARKSETQSFVTVEDFWGGLVIGFLVGYSGTAAFSKITNTGILG